MVFFSVSVVVGAGDVETAEVSSRLLVLVSAAVECSATVVLATVGVMFVAVVMFIVGTSVGNSDSVACNVDVICSSAVAFVASAEVAVIQGSGTCVCCGGGGATTHTNVPFSRSCHHSPRSAKSATAESATVPKLTADACAPNNALLVTSTKLPTERGLGGGGTHTPIAPTENPCGYSGGYGAGGRASTSGGESGRHGTKGPSAGTETSSGITSEGSGGSGANGCPAHGKTTVDPQSPFTKPAIGSVMVAADML